MTRITRCCLLQLLLTCTAAQVLAGPPQLTSEHDEIMYVLLDEPLALTCSCPFYNDSIAWYRYNIPFETFPSSDVPTGMKSGVYGDTLMFPSLRLRDDGWYTCAASNEFGRDEIDFLVIVGEPARITFQLPSSVSVAVQAGTRVELPCRYTGRPYPTLTWFDGNQHQIYDGEDDNRYRIDYTTSSLMIFNITMADALRGPFHCEVSERHGNETGNQIIIDILDPPEGVNIADLQSDITDSTCTHLDIRLGDAVNLTCLDVDTDTITDFNLEFRWLQNNSVIFEENQINIISSTDSDGYYCCEVRGNQTLLNTYCITVATPRKGEFDSRPIDTSIQAGRSLELLCTGNAATLVSEIPIFEWEYSMTQNDERVTERNEIGFSYVSIDRVQVTDEQDYVCVGRNGEGVIEFTVDVRISAICGKDSLVAGNAENEVAAGNNWVPSGSDARVEEVNNERVFVVDYAGPGPSYPSLEQTIDIPPDTLTYYLSARMRRVSSDKNQPMGVPQIRVTLEDGNQMELNLPFGNEAWQWVDVVGPVGEATTLTVTLTVVKGSSGGDISGTAYFDDICVQFQGDDGDDGDDGDNDNMRLIYISGGAGIGAILLILVLIVVCCCCCCCKRKTSSGAMPMHKMSTRLKQMKLSSKRYASRHHEPIDAPEAVYEEINHKKSNQEEEEMYYIHAVESIPSNSVKMPSVKTMAENQYESLKRENDNTYSTASAIPATDERDGTGYLTILPDAVDTGNEQYLELIPTSSVSSPSPTGVPVIPPRSDESMEEQPLGEWEVDPISGEVYSFVNA